MNILKFKAGDIITRNERAVYGYKGDSHGDGSYLGDRVELLGHDRDSKLIFITHPRFDFTSLSYARDGWDEGWEYYPEKMLDKIKSKFKTNS